MRRAVSRQSFNRLTAIESHVDDTEKGGAGLCDHAAVDVVYLGEGSQPRARIARTEARILTSKPAILTAWHLPAKADIPMPASSTPMATTLPAKNSPKR